MEERSEFLPARREGIKRDLPRIIERVADHLTMLPDALRQLPAEYDFDAYIEYGSKVIENHLRHEEQSGLALGALLIVIKSMSGEGKWYEALGRLGIAPRKASMLMLNFRNFGDTPEMVEGLGVAKTALLGRLPEEYRDELKETGRIIMPDGRELHMTAFRQMVLREMNNEIIKVRNEKNEMIRDLKDKSSNRERELEAMTAQYGEMKAYLEKVEADAEPAMAEKIESLKQQLIEKEKAIIDLQAEVDAQKRQLYNEEEVIGAIAEAKKAVDRVVETFNHIIDDKAPGRYANARAELSGFIGYLHHFQTRLTIADEGYED